MSISQTTLTTAVGEVTSLTASAIAAVLTANVFTPGSVAAFSYSAAPNGTIFGTFIAINDGTAGFQADTDSLVYLRDYRISNLQFVSFI